MLRKENPDYAKASRDLDGGAAIPLKSLSKHWDIDQGRFLVAVPDVRKRRMAA